MSTDGTFLSSTRPAGEFRGALVDLTAKHITLSNAAECNPSPATVPTNQAWIGCFAYNVGAVNIVLNDLSVHQLLLP